MPNEITDKPAQLPNLDALGREIADVRRRALPEPSKGDAIVWPAPPREVPSPISWRVYATLIDYAILGATIRLLEWPVAFAVRQAVAYLDISIGRGGFWNAAFSNEVAEAAAVSGGLLLLLGWQLITGRTPGKAVLQLRICGRSQPVGVARLLVRFGSKWLPFTGPWIAAGAVSAAEFTDGWPLPDWTSTALGASMPIVALVGITGWLLALGDDGLALHDRIAGTRVLHDSEQPAFPVVLSGENQERTSN